MSIGLVDTHCHVHSAEYTFDVTAVLGRARESGVDKVILIATSPEDFKLADLVSSQFDMVSVISGIHPHDAANWANLKGDVIKIFESRDIVGVGEIGLDYYYENSSKRAQERALTDQIALGMANGLPFSFHVREAFGDFFSIFDRYNHGNSIKGVVHCFTGTFQEALDTTARGLYLGMGGIMTFSKDLDHARVIKEIPLEKMLLETDSPFLTPAPLRGTINEPTNVTLVAQFIAEARGVSVEEVARTTSDNAQRLFSL